MNKLVEFLDEYPAQLGLQLRKGVITQAEFHIALAFHKNVKAMFENLQVCLIDHATPTPDIG